MDHKQAIEILTRMLDKHRLGEEEKKAVLTAIGVLSWTTLAQSRLKSKKAKRENLAHPFFE